MRLWSLYWWKSAILECYLSSIQKFQALSSFLKSMHWRESLRLQPKRSLYTLSFIRIIYIRIKRFKNRWKTIFWNNLAHHLTSRVLLCSFKLLISFYPIKITFLLTFYVNFVNLGPKNAVYPYVSVRKSSLSKLSEKVHYLKTQQKKLYMKSSAFNRSTWKNKCF